MRQTDAEKLVDLILTNKETMFSQIFDKTHKNIKNFLIQYFIGNTQGIYVLLEGLDIIGAFKIRFHDSPESNSVGFKTLIRNFGFWKGIRAGLLLSFWDEYRPRHHEAFIEFMVIDEKWLGTEARTLLVNKAKTLAKDADARFISYLVSIDDYKLLAKYENYGFWEYKKISSLMARMLKSQYKWRKLLVQVSDEPFTVKGKVLKKVKDVRDVWIRRKEEVFFATRLATGLTAVPIIAGMLAYYKGYPMAAYGWMVVIAAHLIGVVLVYKQVEFGRIALSVAVILESGNMVLRALGTTVWTDRTWQLTLASINLYIAYVMLFANKVAPARETGSIEISKLV